MLRLCHTSDAHQSSCLKYASGNNHSVLLMQVEFLASKGMDDASRAQMMPQSLGALDAMMETLLAERDELLEQVQDQEAAKAEE